MSHVIQMNESCQTHERVMSCTWMSHVTHMNESCHTHEWVMSHTWDMTYTCDMTHIYDMTLAPALDHDWGRMCVCVRMCACVCVCVHVCVCRRDRHGYSSNVTEEDLHSCVTWFICETWLVRVIWFICATWLMWATWLVCITVLIRAAQYKHLHFFGTETLA